MTDDRPRRPPPSVRHGARRRWCALQAAAGLAIAGSATLVAAQEQPAVIERKIDLTEMPLETLMNLEVTSASKKPQRVADAAAAIFVLSQEDIRRSGATTVAEALRLVPGLYVARIDSNLWVVSARGFTGRFTSQNLVLVDGRAVYTPIFSGVLWDVVDMPLEDIDRIEVIRGPGAALWGANAVNSVINIISRRAQDTQGGLVSGGAGTQERGFGTFRYGAKVGDVAFRGFGKYFKRDEFVLNTPRAEDAGDEWDMLRFGFRVDAEATSVDTLTLIGNWHKGTVGEPFAIATLTSPFPEVEKFKQADEGIDVTARWLRTFSRTSTLQAQVYYDWFQRDDLRVPVSLHTIDAELQYRFPLGASHDVVSGMGYRYHRFDSGTGRVASFTPGTADLHHFNLFAQDDLSLVQKVLHLIVGSKLEHTSYTGLEWEPNARLLWTPASNHTLWAAFSRAVRTPSILERQGQFTTVVPPDATTPVPSLVVFQADSQSGHRFQSEKLLAYEAGYRAQLRPELAFDLVAFYHHYQDLLLIESQSTTLEVTPVPHALVTNRFKNGFDSEVYGLELLTDVAPVAWWKLRLAYTYLMRHDYRHPGVENFIDFSNDRTPHHQGYVRSLLDLGRGFELDVTPRYVGALARPNARDYVELDARLGWRSRAVELALVGRNLLQDKHHEFSNPLGGPVPVALQREVFVKGTFRF